MERPVEQRVDRELPEREDARRRERARPARLRERSGALLATVERARETEAQLRVADLVERIAVRVGDELGRGAERHEIEGQARERRDRGMLGATVLAPLRGERASRREVVDGQLAIEARERGGRRRPGGAGPHRRQLYLAERADLPSAREAHRRDERADQAEERHADVQDAQRDGAQRRRCTQPGAGALDHRDHPVPRARRGEAGRDEKHDRAGLGTVRGDHGAEREHVGLSITGSNARAGQSFQIRAGCFPGGLRPSRPYRADFDPPKMRASAGVAVRRVGTSEGGQRHLVLDR